MGDNTENNSSDGGISPQLPRSQSGISVKSKRSIPSQKSASRTSVDEPTCIAAELHDLPEGSESGDSETATEVDVSYLKINNKHIPNSIFLSIQNFLLMYTIREEKSF